MKSALYEGIPVKPSNWFNPLTALFAPNFSYWWYLGALIWWRSLGSLIKSFPAYGRLLLACLLGAMVTYAKTPVLDLIWLRYFPNFVAGQLFPYDQVCQNCDGIQFQHCLGSRCFTQSRRPKSTSIQ